MGTMARSFFLGAGFMLVETKAVVQMALSLGGTWMVNTVVFAAILVMSLAGNLFAGRVNPRRLEPYYVGLFAALAIGLAIPPATFLGLNPTVQILGVCALVFAPIAFAGVIFATTFKRTAQPDRVFGANIAGALVGGLSENASVLLGLPAVVVRGGGVLPPVGGVPEIGKFRSLVGCVKPGFAGADAPERGVVRLRSKTRLTHPTIRSWGISCCRPPRIALCLTAQENAGYNGNVQPQSLS